MKPCAVIEACQQRIMSRDQSSPQNVKWIKTNDPYAHERHRTHLAAQAFGVGMRQNKSAEREKQVDR